MVNFSEGLDLRPNIQSSAGSITNLVTAYEFDYFSGAQISIYCGDILVDDVDSIQFFVTQSKRPIYGYGSQYFHTIADGQVLVEGTFSIPFKEADYILAVLERYMQDRAPVEEIEPLVNPQTGKQISSRYLVSRENIERYLERIHRSNTIDDPYELAQDLGALPDEAFEDIAEQFEDLLWRKPEEKFLEPNLTSVTNNSAYTRRADQFPSFDIFILYGDISNAAANHTIKRLIDVSIIGQGQAIHVGGEAVREEYRFIARNLA